MFKRINFFIFCILALVCLASPRMSYCQPINYEELTNEIALKFENQSPTEGMYLLNTKGLYLCADGQYALALQDFNDVLRLSFGNSVEEFLVALWGKAICDAFLGHAVPAQQDIELLESLSTICCKKCAEEKMWLIVQNDLSTLLPDCSMINHASSKNNKPKDPPEDRSLFTTPNVELSPKDCYQMASGIGNFLRAMVDEKYKFVNTLEATGALHEFYEFIRRIEQVAGNCCYNGTRWTICCTPIARIHKQWKDYGLPSKAPKYDADFNLTYTQF